MSQELQKYEFGGHLVRIVEVDGEPWFVLSDLCSAAGIANPWNVVNRVEADDLRRVEVIDSMGRRQMANAVNEGGMNDVIVRSDSPNARPFRRWVTHEVLPAIRKTGSYSIQPVNPYEELLPKSFPEALRQLAQTHERVEMLDTKVRELTPKADSFDEFMASDGTEGVGKVGKMFDIGEVKFFEMLREGGIFISKGAMRNTPYQQYMHHFLVKAKAIKHRDGSVSMAHTTYVKPSGVDFIGRKLGLTRVSEQLELFEGGDAA